MTSRYCNICSFVWYKVRLRITLDALDYSSSSIVTIRRLNFSTNITVLISSTPLFTSSTITISFSPTTKSCKVTIITCIVVEVLDRTISIKTITTLRINVKWITITTNLSTTQTVISPSTISVTIFVSPIVPEEGTSDKVTSNIEESLSLTISPAEVIRTIGQTNTQTRLTCITNSVIRGCSVYITSNS